MTFRSNDHLAQYPFCIMTIRTNVHSAFWPSVLWPPALFSQNKQNSLFHLNDQHLWWNPGLTSKIYICPMDRFRWKCGFTPPLNQFLLSKTLKVWLHLLDWLSFFAETTVSFVWKPFFFLKEKVFHTTTETYISCLYKPPNLHMPNLVPFGRFVPKLCRNFFFWLFSKGRVSYRRANGPSFHSSFYRVCLGKCAKKKKKLASIGINLLELFFSYEETFVQFVSWAPFA